jgi:hypothetical protein
MLKLSMACKIAAHRILNFSHNKIAYAIFYLLVKKKKAHTLYIGDVQPLPWPWDSKDKEISAMLDDICIANKQNPLSMSSNMTTVT